MNKLEQHKTPSTHLPAWQERMQIRQRALTALRNGEFDLAERALASNDYSLAEIVEDLQIYQAELEIQNEELRASQLQNSIALDRFRALFLGIPLPTFVVDRNGVILEANDLCLSVFKLEKRHLRQHFFLHLIHDRDKPRVAAMLTDECSRGVCSSHEVALKREGQFDLIGDMHVTQLPPDVAGTKQFICTVVDESAAIAQRKALATSEERWKFALEGAGETVWEWNLDTDKISFSTRLNEMLGMDPAELKLGFEEWKTFIHPQDLPQVLDEIDAYLAGKAKTFETEHRTRHTAGHWVWMSARGMAVSRNAAGRPNRMIGTQADISERKRIEEELARHHSNLEELVTERTLALSIAKEAAEAANRAKSSFLAHMSHELRTPMNAIMGMTDLVLRHSSDHSQVDKLTKVMQASRHLLAVINDILDISKIEAEHLKLEHIDFKLGSIVENLKSLVAHKIDGRGLNLHTDIDPVIANLPVQGDPLRIGQILLNLTGNAIKFTFTGAITVHARIVDESPADVLVRFEVLDTGIGIAANDQKRLFTPFEQADSSMTRKYGGTGLGLAISKRLVQLMGGEIGFISEQGKGSTFWFTARLARADHPIESFHEEAIPMAEKLLKTRFAGARILLAEDEPINQEVSRELIEEVGLKVDLAEDGAQALALAKHTDYDLILMDMQMPRMNGVEATRAIRDLPGRAHTPIIAMTANAFDEDRQTCIDAGMNDHLGKPVDPDRLFETLLHWLEKKS